MGVGGSRTSKQFSSTSWYPTILFNSDIIFLEIASYRVRIQPFKTAAPTCFRHPLQVEVVTAFHTPPLGSINLLEQPTDLRGTFYLLDYPCIIKGHTSRTVRWKRWIGQGIGRRCGVSVPSLKAPAPQMSTCSSTQKLSRLCPFGVLWRLHYKEVID